MSHRSLVRVCLLASAISVGSVLAGMAQDTAKRKLGVADPKHFATLDGFAIELVYEVPGETQGSWVSLTVDPKGRLLACAQDGGLYRIDVSGQTAKVEPLSIDVIGAQGLLCAFDSLYVNLNTPKHKSGIWRLTDTDGDDQYDKKEHLVDLNAAGEHGPHAMILTPDKKRILFCCGNNTDIPKNVARSRVPKVWGEDHLLGRMPDARGHNANRMAPGGFVMSMNPDGSELELVATGFRNEYDIALNRDGELFAFDADMEWDVGTPWYRPTRVNHVTSGTEFGWRNGTGKWPAYYPDSLGAAVDIGPGSPTGIAFGYGTKYPKKYQDALFLCDWSYGNIYAVHLQPDGSTYEGSYETFTTAAPLPVTDIVAREADGMLYFTIGGRGTQSGLYRIRYTGDGKTAAEASRLRPAPANLREKRHKLEDLHLSGPSEQAIATALDALADEDRAMAFAARIALEHQPVDLWRKRIDTLQTPQAKSLAVIALARQGKPEDRQLAMQILGSIDWEQASPNDRIALLRAYSLVSMRLGVPTEEEKGTLGEKFVAYFPSGENRTNRELAQWLVYLESPPAIGKIVAEMRNAPSQEDQIHYAMSLRNATKGWNPDLRRSYLKWFTDIQSSSHGGMSYGGFIENIKAEHVKHLSEKALTRFADVINSSKADKPEDALPQRKFVKQWTVDDLLPTVADESRAPDYENGRAMFAAAQCYKCHRMGIQGGILGPDLTSAGGKFNYRDLLISIIEPSKVISDQYGATQFLTDDGRAIVGRVVNMNKKEMMVMTNMLNPSDITNVNIDSVEESSPSKASMMPTGLLDTLQKEDVADLVAYLRAGGNAKHTLYAVHGNEEEQPWISFSGTSGPGIGKRIVLVSGDEEYRSEEALPQLAKILSTHLGFDTTVLFAVEPETGLINPDVVTNIPGTKQVANADLMVIATRMRKLPDSQMKPLVDFIEAGKPIVALRTATHAFNNGADSGYAKYAFQFGGEDFKGGFGKQVLGETWVAHHGKHKSEATLGIVADKEHPIARGLSEGSIFGPTDVYRVNLPLPGDSHAIVLGQILVGMNPDDPAVTDDRNDPMMPIAWTKTYKGGRTFTTTMGAASDLPSEGVRRMIINGCLWALGMEDKITPDLNVSVVGKFDPTAYGFGSYVKGKKPRDYR